ncbi:hypothetical protein [Bremerella cremea]|uniref:hypothetical protein n=1 Tax=Bremerella cremea TaxID=1031537 RepID=UPI0031E55F4F
MKHANRSCRMWILSMACLLVGCQQTSPQQDYATEALGLTSELTESGMRWGQEMRPWFEGEKVDIEAAKRSHEKALQDVKNVRRKINALTVPSDPDSQAFAQKLQAYLDWQVELFDTEFRSYCEAAEQENPGSPETRQEIAMRLTSVYQDELQRKQQLSTAVRKLGLNISP